MNGLGKWAVIDIETTGIDESYDEIIDLGYLQFEGTKLVKKYSSLVKTEKILSQFIQKLTGITPGMMKNAPLWERVEPDLLSLQGHELIAHNAFFEKKFLEGFFTDEEEGVFFVDTFSFFALIFPEKKKLGLEGLLIESGIADEEIHRGFEDSRDLLKMMLFSLEYLFRDQEKRKYIQGLLLDLDMEKWRWGKFLQLPLSEVREIASEIDFDSEDCVDRYLEKTLFKKNEKLVFAENFPEEFNSQSIEKVFSENGPIEEVYPDFEKRESQKQMALKVGQSFANGVHSLIQAPTGTGKTLAYLVPSALFMGERAQRVLIATGTKTLQEQIMNKDIPRLRQIMGDREGELRIIRLVGSSNHLCELLFQDQFFGAQISIFKRGDEDFLKAYLQMIFFHNSREPNENRVLKDEVPYILKRTVEGLSEVLEEVKVDYRSCVGSQCSFASRCSYLQGLRDASDAEMIIGNHALMFQWPKGVDRPSHIIVDEAHRIEGEASKAYSLVLDKGQLDSMTHLLTKGQGLGALFYLLLEIGEESQVEKIKEDLEPLGEELIKVSQELDFLFESFFKGNSRYSSLYWNELPMVTMAHPDGVGKRLFKKLDSLKEVLTSYYRILFPFVETIKERREKDEAFLMAFTRFENTLGILEDSYLLMSALFEEGLENCQQLKYHEEFGYSMEVTAVDIGKTIEKELLEPSESVVYTSATLANHDGTSGTQGVHWMTGYAYLPPEKRFKKGLYLDGVFDYEKDAKVFLSTDTPYFNHVDFIPHIVKKLSPVMEELGGRTLMLFSSRKRFEQACELMLERFEGVLNIYIQGLGSQVVERFQEDSHGVLIGMESFGEGIDIPGEKLQFIYIDKVPDMRISLLSDARKDFFERSFGNSFVDYYLAQRARSLHQKLGRLIRRQGDRGAIIITDSRLSRWKMRTISQFAELMKPYHMERLGLDEACSEVLEFIQGGS